MLAGRYVADGEDPTDAQLQGQHEQVKDHTVCQVHQAQDQVFPFAGLVAGCRGSHRCRLRLAASWPPPFRYRRGLSEKQGHLVQLGRGEICSWSTFRLPSATPSAAPSCRLGRWSGTSGGSRTRPQAFASLFSKTLRTSGSTCSTHPRRWRNSWR